MPPWVYSWPYRNDTLFFSAVKEEEKSSQELEGAEMLARKSFTENIQKL